MPKKRGVARPALPALSTLERRALLYGVWGLKRPDQDPTVTPGDLGRTFELLSDDVALARLWALHRDALLLEWAATHGDDGSRPWAAEQFEPEAIDVDTGDDDRAA